MATIRKRQWAKPDGTVQERWQVDFTDQAGKRRAKQFRLKRDADKYLVKARAAVSAGTYTPESSTVTIGEAIGLWIERATAEKLERATISGYEQHRAHILAAIDTGTRLARLTQARCEQLRDDLLKAHSRPMARKILTSFKSVIKDAKRRGLIAHNVAAETTIGTAKRHRPRLEVGGDFPTPAEVKALVSTATGEALALICLAAFAGLRASELRGLRWSDLDLGAKPSVTVAQRADRWSKVGSPKSASAQRAIPLGETATRALRAWKLAQPTISYLENGEKRQRPATLVFGTATDRPDLLGNIRRRQLEPAMLAAGVAVPALDANGKPVKDKKGKPVMRPKYTGLHCLRHFAISTWLRTCQGDFKRVQSWAGHATLALTLDTYGHLIPRTDDHAMIADAERDLFA